MTTAAEFATRLHANVDAFYDNQLDYRDFGLMQREIWSAIGQAGLTDDVLAILRNNPTPPPVSFERRVMLHDRG